MITIEGKQYYTAREFAEQNGVYKNYICRLAREGKLPGKKTDLGWILPVDETDQAWAGRNRKRGRK